MGWEFFAHFDAHDKESVKGTCQYFIDVPEKFMTEHGFGTEMSHITSKMRRPDGYSYTQEEQNKMYKNIPGTNIFTYQWKVREAFNPNHLCGSYYQTCDPEAITK